MLIENMLVEEHPRNLLETCRYFHDPMLSDFLCTLPISDNYGCVFFYFFGGREVDRSGGFLRDNVRFNTPLWAVA